MRARIGTQSQLPTLKIGVFGFCTDSNKLYIGSSVGNLPILLANPPLTGAGSPLSVVTPTFIGQTYVDTTAKEAYIANSLSSADWQSISMDELGSGGGGSSDWSTITNKPNFATVATSGSYNDLSNKPTLSATTANITYYVSNSGSDSNDGLTVGTPFLTIQKAFDTIPKFVFHAVTVQLATGTYDGLHTMSSFFGGGSITLKGGTDLATSVNYIVKGTVYGLNNLVKTSVQFIKPMPSTFTAYSSLIKFDGCFNANVVSCSADGTKGTYTGTTLYGINYQRSTGYIYLSDVSNISASSYPSQGYAIYSNMWSTINSESNTGSNNATGLASLSGATIGKTGTQPSGTTMEYVGNGGAIR